MWIVTDAGTLVNLEAVRSVGIEVSDDRQFVEVQVRWSNGGERFSIVSLIVQEYGDVKLAMAIAEEIVLSITAKLVAEGKVLELPHHKQTEK
jgi:hypothetical protein